jgi:BlaI family penicillinase repressor
MFVDGKPDIVRFNAILLRCIFTFNMNRLTRAEEQVMQILWEMGEGMTKDVISHFPDPKPAYNTVSTVIRVLEKKGIVDHRAYGKTHVYFPLLEKEAYARVQFMGFMHDYFNNSFPRMAAFFAREKNLDISEMEEILKLTEQEIPKIKSKKDG